MKRGVMSKIVRTSYDTENPPPLSDAERDELARLIAMGDEDIDTSDIPDMTSRSTPTFSDTT